MEDAERQNRLLDRMDSTGWTAKLLRHVWIVPIVLIALWLRLTGIASEHLYGDEAEYAIVARYLSRDFLFLSYPQIEGMGATPFVSQPPLILYLMAISMKIFGATDFAAILPSALFGAATVVAVYALGYRLGGRFMGIAAAALLAVLPFHVEVSRRAMLDAGYAFFLVLTAYFAVAWLQTRSRKHAFGTGAAAAGAALSKLPGVLAGPAILILFAAALAVTLARAARGRAEKGEVKETLLQGGIATVPIAVGAFAYLALLTFLQATRDLWVKLLWQLGRVDTAQSQTGEAAAVARDASFYFTDPSFSFQAQMGELVFALAIVGVLVALARFAIVRSRGLEHLTVPVFTIVLLAFFLYSDRKEGFYLLPFAPLAAVSIAYAGDGLWRMLSWAGLKFTPQSVAPKVTLVALILGLLVVAAPAYGAAAESYEDFALGETQEKYFGYGVREAGHWIHEQDPEAGQYGTLLGRFSLLWYNEQPTYHWYMDQTFIRHEVEQGNLKYIVYEDYLQLPYDRDFMRQLIDEYDGQAVKTFREGWGEVTVFELHP